MEVKNVADDHYDRGDDNDDDKSSSEWWWQLVWVMMREVAVQNPAENDGSDDDVGDDKNFDGQSYGDWDEKST